MVNCSGRLPPGHEYSRLRRLLEAEGVIFTGPNVQHAHPRLAPRLRAVKWTVREFSTVSGTQYSTVDFVWSVVDEAADSAAAGSPAASVCGLQPRYAAEVALSACHWLTTNPSATRAAEVSSRMGNRLPPDHSAPCPAVRPRPWRTSGSRMCLAKGGL